MAAIKTVDQGVAYHVVDAHSNHLVLAQAPATISAQTITLTRGGNQVVLSKQNVTDLLSALTAFSTSGTLT